MSFRAAVELYDFCETDEGRRLGASGWQFIAGRDGAMTLWHFAKSIETIRTAHLDRRLYPILVGLVDFSKTREAEREFKKLFPEFYDVRLAVAHAGEIAADMEHAVIGPSSKLGINIDAGASVWMSNCFVGRSFTVTFEKQILSYPLTRESLAALDRIKRIFFSAFVEADKELTGRASGGPSDPGALASPQPQD